MAASATTGLPCNAKAISAPTMAATKAKVRRWVAARMSPRFQASSGPKGTAIRIGTNSGAKVRLKKGAPTEIFAPVNASSASG